MDDDKASQVSLSEILKIQLYMLFYIHKPPPDVGTSNALLPCAAPGSKDDKSLIKTYSAPSQDSVKQQTEPAFDAMVEDGLPDAIGVSPSQTSKARTEPEQTVSYPASTVGDSAEVSISSHAAVSTLSAASCCQVPVMGDLPTGVGKPDSSNPGPPGMATMRINYLPTACEQRKTLTLAIPCCCQTVAQREPQQGGRLNDFPLDPSLAPALRPGTFPTWPVPAPTTMRLHLLSEITCDKSRLHRLRGPSPTKLRAG